MKISTPACWRKTYLKVNHILRRQQDTTRQHPGKSKSAESYVKHSKKKKITSIKVAHFSIRQSSATQDKRLLSQGMKLAIKAWINAVYLTCNTNIVQRNYIGPRIRNTVCVHSVCQNIIQKLFLKPEKSGIKHTDGIYTFIATQKHFSLPRRKKWQPIIFS